jgi:hypothetical protein
MCTQTEPENAKMRFTDSSYDYDDFEDIVWDPILDVVVVGGVAELLLVTSS